MTLRRKKRFERAIRCSICKQKTAYHTVHGFLRYGGSTCCDICYKIVLSEY